MNSRSIRRRGAVPPRTASTIRSGTFTHAHATAGSVVLAPSHDDSGCPHCDHDHRGAALRSRRVARRVPRARLARGFRRHLVSVGQSLRPGNIDQPRSGVVFLRTGQFSRADAGSLGYGKPRDAARADRHGQLLQRRVLRPRSVCARYVHALGSVAPAIRIGRHDLASGPRLAGRIQLVHQHATACRRCRDGFREPAAASDDRHGRWRRLRQHRGRDALWVGVGGDRRRPASDRLRECQPCVAPVPEPTTAAMAAAAALAAAGLAGRRRVRRRPAAQRAPAAGAEMLEDSPSSNCSSSSRSSRCSSGSSCPPCNQPARAPDAASA